VKRKARKYDVSNFLKEFPELRGRDVEIWIDLDNVKEILEIITEKGKDGNYIRQDRFKLILYTLFRYQYNEDLYAQEKINNRASKITAMKFKKHRGKNIRIYCKEFEQSGKKIVMITSTNKTTQSVGKKLITLIESIGKYEYEF
jgi:hypothetical protein